MKWIETVLVNSYKISFFSKLHVKSYIYELYMNIYELRLQMHTLYVVHNIMISFQTFLLLFFFCKFFKANTKSYII